MWRLAEIGSEGPEAGGVRRGVREKKVSRPARTGRRDSGLVLYWLKKYLIFLCIYIAKLDI